MGDTTAVAKAGRGGAFNGQLATQNGAKTLAPTKPQGSLDKTTKGSAAGVLKK